jgi:anthranilate/para-aminobenzoate synthase component I
VRAFKARYHMPELRNLPRFTGGLVGYFGYETVRFIEPKLGALAKPDEIDVPDIMLLVSDEVVVFDNLAGKLYVVIHVNPAIDEAYNKACRRLDDLIAHLRDADRLRRTISFPDLRARSSRPRCRSHASISATVTSCRWSWRNACQSHSSQRRSIFIGRYAR